MKEDHLLKKEATKLNHSLLKIQAIKVPATKLLKTLLSMVQTNHTLRNVLRLSRKMIKSRWRYRYLQRHRSQKISIFKGLKWVRKVDLLLWAINNQVYRNSRYLLNLGKSREIMLSSRKVNLTLKNFLRKLVGLRDDSRNFQGSLFS